MPFIFTITKEDQQRNKLVQPGWYVCKVKSITQGPGKNDPQSITTTVEFVIEDGPAKDAIGVPLTHWASEKAAGLQENLIVALTGKKLDPNGTSVDLEPAIGRKIKVYVKNDKYQGRMVNRCEDFAPMA